MQQLHLVGFTADHEGIILATRQGSQSGGFVLVLDEAILANIDEARRLADGPAPAVAKGVDSGLRPREMQARIRAGRSVAEVAAAARAFARAWASSCKASGNQDIRRA